MNNHQFNLAGSPGEVNSLLSMWKDAGGNMGLISDGLHSFDELNEKIKKLEAFKSYVHQRLDDAGIEKEPNAEHSKHGCRIGDRLDILLSKK